MKGFSVNLTFDGEGRRQSEGAGAWWRTTTPDTDTLEIDQVRMRSISPEGRVTAATRGVA